ncbi:hypothetical protein ENBRE01_1647 [Enteropsectra breve]|nr:hypothetical protein ENBRE01_1647 [Enteropsectra breve]
MLMVAKLATRNTYVRKEGTGVTSAKKTRNTSFNIALGMEIHKAVMKTKIGYEASCAFHCYLSAAFKKHVEERVVPDYVAIEGSDSAELLNERYYREYYRKLLKLQGDLNIKQGMIRCGEEEMCKFLDYLSVLKDITNLDALNAIRRKSEITGEMTDIKYYTENIAVLPKRVCDIVFGSLHKCSQENSIRRKRPLVNGDNWGGTVFWVKFSGLKN